LKETVLDNVIDLPFVSNFSLEIEELVKEKKTSNIDAVVLWCEREKIDIQVGGELAKKSDIIREKIQLEAEDLHFLPKSARLF
jgi:hypothetical protein